MKLKHKPFCWLAFLVIGLNFTPAVAQTKADVFNGSTDITWLGLDFSQTKFIGSATQFKDAGQINNEEFRDKYIPAWNQLIVNEPKKYNVAEAVHRSSVKYAIEVTDKANSAIKKDFFSENLNDFKVLDEQKIAGLVSGYDFQGKDGIGLLFFVEGMSKGKDQLGAWVTFVNMKAKTVLFTTYETAKPGGFGFRNYWAKPYDVILNNIKSEFKKWQN